MLFAAAPLPSSFQAGLANAVNTPTVICVLVAGFAIGYLLARVWLDTQVGAGPPSPGVMLAVTSSTMLTLQVSSIAGQIVHAPVRTDAYVGSHIGFVALSLLCAGATALGVAAAKRRAHAP